MLTAPLIHTHTDALIYHLTYCGLSVHGGSLGAFSKDIALEIETMGGKCDTNRPSNCPEIRLHIFTRC